MRVVIKDLFKDSPEVEALLMRPYTLTINDGRSVVNELYAEYADDIDIGINCNSIQVNDDRISIEFPDGYIADYEICSNDYHFITIS